MRFKVTVRGFSYGEFTQQAAITFLNNQTSVDGGEISRRITSLAVGEDCSVGLYIVERIE